MRDPTLRQGEQTWISDARVGRVDYHQHKSLVKALRVSFRLFVLRENTVLEKD